MLHVRLLHVVRSCTDVPCARLASTVCLKVTEVDGKIGPEASSHLKYAQKVFLYIGLFSLFRSEYC